MNKSEKLWDRMAKYFDRVEKKMNRLISGLLKKLEMVCEPPKKRSNKEGVSDDRE